MVTGGHAPGTAQLAATASTSSTPDARSKATSSPVPMSMAVMRRSRSGHPCDGSRWAITSRRTDSETVAVDRATAPMRCSFCALVASGSDSAFRNSSVMSSMSTRGSSSFECPDDLALVQLVETQPATELGGDRRPGRRADDHVGTQQRVRRLRRLVFDSPQNAGFPGDSRQATACQHQCPLRCHRQSLPGRR